MDTIWISWHLSRRSVSLSKELNVPLVVYVNERNAFTRHLFSSLWTIYILLKERPSKIFMQYSFMLLLVVYFYKKIRRKYVCVVCDCHTKALRRKLENNLSAVFFYLKKLTFQASDICIISNEELIDEVKIYCNNHVVLPDPIPVLTYPSDVTFKNENYCVYSNSYSIDEPFAEVVEAAKKLNGILKIFITGRIPNDMEYLKSQPYENIYFTDFLPDDKYNALLANAQCVLALTTEESTLLCASYEALSLNTPLITSDTRVLREYFHGAVIHSKITACEISESIKNCLQQKTIIKKKMLKLKKNKQHEINMKLSSLMN